MLLSLWWEPRNAKDRTSQHTLLYEDLFSYLLYIISGKNTSHFIGDIVTKSCPTLCYPMDCSRSGSFIHGIFQARIQVWVAISYPSRTSWPRDWTCSSCISCIAGGFFTTEPPGKPLQYNFILLSLVCFILLSLVNSHFIKLGLFIVWYLIYHI